MIFRLLTFFSIFFLTGAVGFAENSSKAFPSPRLEKRVEAYQPGERLVYELSYLGVPAGEATLEVIDRKEMKGREVYHVVSTAESNDFVSFFYPVKDRIESFIDVEGGYSHAIKVKQRQGKKKRDKVVDFDQVRHRAVRFKDNKVETFSIPAEVQDALSSLYFFRSQEDLEVGNSIYVDVHASRKNWELEIQVLAKEELRLPMGTFKTVKIKALVRFEGIFIDKGDVIIWMTDDYRHVPLKINTKIKIGSVNAVLTSGVKPLSSSKSAKTEQNYHAKLGR